MGCLDSPFLFVAPAVYLLHQRLTERRGLQIILAALTLYGLAFIWKSSFILDGKRFFCLLDDAMISMRYAKHFAAGDGLVWNIGEFIEGFTNLLWTLYMSLWHRLPIEPNMLSLPIQLTSLAVLLFAAIQIYRISSKTIDNTSLRLCATAFAVFYFPLVMWSLLGMEVGVITAVLMLCVKWALSALEHERFDANIYLLLGMLTLVRFDTVIFLLAISLFLAWHQKHVAVKHIAMLVLMLVIFIGGQTLWRYDYYGEFFPNTYYLKATGYPIYYRISRGLYVLLNFLHQPNLLISLAPIVYVLWKRTRETNLLLILIATAMMYSVYVGGDAWEGDGGANRYLLPVMPLYFILLFKLIERVWRIVKERMPEIMTDRKSKTVATIAIALLYLGYNTPNITALNPNSFEELFLIGKPFSTREHKSRIVQAQWIEQHTTKDASIAVTWAGITPYFTDRRFIDLYGKADSVIARMPAKPWKGAHALLSFFPGHNKWDYDYSIGKLTPDVVAQLVEIDDKPVKLLENYVAVPEDTRIVYLKKESPHIHMEAYNIDR